MSDPLDRAALLYQLFALYRKEGLVVSYTMEDFRREFIKEHRPELTPQEQGELLRAWPAAWRLLSDLPLEIRLGGLPPEARLVGLTLAELEDMRRFLDTAIASLKEAQSRKPRRKKSERRARCAGPGGSDCGERPAEEVAAATGDAQSAEQVLVRGEVIV
jgi:hypothetical protein